MSYLNVSAPDQHAHVNSPMRCLPNMHPLVWSGQHFTAKKGWTRGKSVCQAKNFCRGNENIDVVVGTLEALFHGYEGQGSLQRGGKKRRHMYFAASISKGNYTVWVPLASAPPPLSSQRFSRQTSRGGWHCGIVPAAAAGELWHMHVLVMMIKDGGGGGRVEEDEEASCMAAGLACWCFSCRCLFVFLMCVCGYVIIIDINHIKNLKSSSTSITSPSSHHTPQPQAARLLLLLMTTAQGELIFALVRGKTTPLRLLSSYPLRFLVPTKCAKDNHTVDCCWVYSLNYGGGLVAGDDVRISCDVGSGCTVVITTQGSTKIYKMLPRRAAAMHKDVPVMTRQHFSASVAATATLALLPDPFTCFRGSNYQQVQEVHLQRGGNLVMVDWYTSGRMGRGESWVFDRLASETRVHIDGELFLWEPLVLEGDATVWRESKGSSSGSAAADGNGIGNGRKRSETSLAARMGPYECFALLIIVGPRFETIVQQIAETQGRPSFNTRHQQQHTGGLLGQQQQQQQQRQQQQQGQPPTCVSSLCRLLEQGGPDGPGLALKIAGQTTEEVYQLLSTLLAPLAAVVGSRPYSTM